MELVDGMIYEMPLAGFKHGVDSGNVLGFIGTHVRAHDLGRVTNAGTSYCLHIDDNGKDTIVAPDVGFIAKARSSEAPSRKYVPFTPDLAVEMVSTNDKAEEIHAKVNKYLQYGTRIIWVAYPETRTVVIHTPSGAQTLGENETLDGGDVLPGFKLLIREIFSV